MIYLDYNLLTVAKLHNVLGLHFDVYKLPRIQEKTLLESNRDFPQICPRSFFEDGHVTGRRWHQTKNSPTIKFLEILRGTF
jgi:hypothetical protein